MGDGPTAPIRLLHYFSSFKSTKVVTSQSYGDDDDDEDTGHSITTVYRYLPRTSDGRVACVRRAGAGRGDAPRD